MYEHPDIARVAEAQRYEMLRHNVETWRLQHRWLLEQGYRLLCRLGQVLVTLGRRLESYERPASVSRWQGARARRARRETWLRLWTSTNKPA